MQTGYSCANSRTSPIFIISLSLGKHKITVPTFLGTTPLFIFIISILYIQNIILSYLTYWICKHYWLFFHVCIIPQKRLLSYPFSDLLAVFFSMLFFTAPFYFLYYIFAYAFLTVFEKNRPTTHTPAVIIANSKNTADQLKLSASLPSV